MTKQSWYIVLLFGILILALLYFALTSLQTQTNFFLGIVILWAILLPVLSSFPYSINYIISLPSPIFGTWFLLLLALGKYANLSIYLMLLSLLGSFLSVFIIHVLTRHRTMLWKISMATISRSGIASISVIFFALGMMLINPSIVMFDTPSGIFYFAVIVFAYIASSMLYINSSYRLFVLSNRLGVFHLEGALSEIWADIKRKLPDGQRELEVLQYYFYESLRCFLEGNFEKSLIWGYKVIREKTVVDPLEYIDDKRMNKPSFSDVRNTLEHSTRKGRLDANRISQVIRNIFEDCLDLLEREFIFIRRVSEQPLKSDKTKCDRP